MLYVKQGSLLCVYLIMYVWNADSMSSKKLVNISDNMTTSIVSRPSNIKQEASITLKDLNPFRDPRLAYRLQHRLFMQGFKMYEAYLSG